LFWPDLVQSAPSPDGLFNLVRGASYTRPVSSSLLIVHGRFSAAKMSRYLADRISGLSNVEVLTQTVICGLEGSGGVLEAVRWRGPSSEDSLRPVRHLFLFIGADPNTDWLNGSGVALDHKGFVLTGGRPGRTGRWRRACLACSPLATSARVLSRGSPPRSARAPRLWQRCTPSGPMPRDR
jgi:hypothetical protein